MKQKRSRQLYNQYQEEIQERIECMHKLENTPIDLILQAFPEARCTSWGLRAIDFWFPFRFELIPIIKEFMELQYPEYQLVREDREIWNNTATHTIRYEWEIGLTLNFTLSTINEGTTCVLHEIGVEVIPAKTKKIYELICQEGAQEGSF